MHKLLGDVRAQVWILIILKNFCIIFPMTVSDFSECPGWWGVSNARGRHYTCKLSISASTRPFFYERTPQYVYVLLFHTYLRPIIFGFALPSYKLPFAHNPYFFRYISLKQSKFNLNIIWYLQELNLTCYNNRLLFINYGGFQKSEENRLLPASRPSSRAHAAIELSLAASCNEAAQS